MSSDYSSGRKKLAGLSGERAKLVELLLDKEADSTQQIRRYPRDRTAASCRLPTSWAQHRLWFIDQLEGGGAAYNIPIAMRLRGRLDESAVRSAVDELVRRHEALRTVFVNVAGEPKQEIASDGHMPLPLIDLSSLSQMQRDAQLQLHESEEIRTPFDLGTGPLIRGRLLRLHPDQHVLLITMHHIVSDGWSIGVLIRELTELYQAHRDGRSSSLPQLPIQYGDYAQWQRRWLRGKVLDQQLSYWRDHLKNAPSQLDLPADRQRPAVHSYRGGSVAVRLDAQLSAALKRFAQRHQLTLFMVLYAAWAILLARLSGQHDVSIGTPVANRRRAELEGLIGFFVNTLVLRIDVADELQVKEFLQRVRRVTLDAYEHQDIPFEQIVEAVKPPRSLSRHPIFQVSFALQNAPQGELRLPDLDVIMEETVTETAKFDLLLALQESGQEIAGTADYAADLFDRSTIERWISCYKVLLQDLMRGDDRRLCELNILDESERRRVIESFNATQADLPRDGLLHRLFERQVVLTPDAIAVTRGDEELSYAQLNRRANQLAHYLRARGIGPDCLIGLCMERSLDLVATLLGVLKAGGAYLPLDPSYPVERLGYMLADSRPRLLLTQEHLKSSLPDTDVRTVAVDTEWSIVATYPDTDLEPRELGLHPSHLAYVIYTSGSTGKPKGTMLEHRGACNLAAVQRHAFAVRSDSRVLQFSSLSFDACTWEWIMALSAGGRLCMASRDALIPGEPLLATLRGLRITHATLPPVALGALPANEELSDLTHLVVAGEACSPTLMANWAPGRRFINAYGPTEATVCASMHVCNPKETTNPPIGRPIANARIYILDQRGRVVPAGVVGQIYLAGVGLARGYLNRPELTAERFVADPFSAEPNARMYKTGDLGRWRADGTIEYLGRNDHQVKIRGFRVELGEIEAQLTRCDAVKESAVLMREDVSGDRRLVAYVVPNLHGKSAAAPSAEDLRAHLKDTLPEYMLPSAFVTIERLPLTPNGKLDRRALPAPDSGAYVHREYEEPRGQVEEILAGIWQALLGVERVGRQDNFFELGGHSLLIVQMMDRLRRVGLAGEVRRVFESPTLADLASKLTREAAGQFEVPPNLIPADCTAITPQMLTLVELDSSHIERIVKSVPGGAANIQDIYPLAPLQEGILFHHLMDQDGGDAYVLPIVFSVDSRARVDALIAALQALIDRHDVLRTAVLWEGLPQPVQVVYRRADLPVAEVTLDDAGDTSQRIKEWISPERQRLDIRQAPFMRLQVAPNSNGEWYVLLQLHHMTIDHVALQIVTSEVVAHLEGRAQLLPDCVPYRDHVAQSLAYARTHDARAFFRHKLADIDEPTAPFGLLDVHGGGADIAESREQFPAGLALRVRSEARRQGVSAATLFHAAWALVVAHTSRRDDVVFGSVLLGRLQGTVGAQRTLGMFINTLPLRLQLKDVTATRLVELAQCGLVELLTHEQASLADAQRCSGIEGTAPLFTSLLNFRHSVPDPDAEWSSASGIRVLTGQERTNYPITMSVDDLGAGFSLSALTDRRLDARRIMSYLRTGMQSLLDALEQKSSAPVLELPILPEGERREILERNRAPTPYPRDKVIHELFEAQVKRTPAAVAVLHDQRSMTYAEINGEANKLARFLRRRGVGPDRLVAICMERGLEMIVGLLGILKAGGAYVPLDPNYPADRLQHMLHDAEPTAILTTTKLRSTLPASSAEVIALDEQQHDLSSELDGDIATTQTGLTPHHLLYVIYTSGSTGKPKGTQMAQHSMVNLIEWHREAFGSSENQRVLQFAALSFDVAFQEIFSTLCTGGTLVMLDEWVRKDARALLELLSRQSIQRLFAPPLMLQSLAEYFDAAGSIPLSLNDVISAGEQLRVTEEMVRFFKRLGGCRLHNHYGPTETHVVTALTLAGDAEAWPALPSIGQPIANTRIYILDARRQLVPLGVAGEIYIAGANVAQGYLRRAQLTEERFVRDPFVEDPTARAYKTGDLGRWRPDGSIEYLGRNDDQVKIRGYRIELGEIEAELAAHPLVKDTAVLVREDTPGAKRLVAYVTSHSDDDLDPDELRAHLKLVLPAYMLPSAFVLLPSLPLTPSGKLDRRALPPPELQASSGGEYQPPQGPVEETLAEIWQNVLGVQRIGREDNFFDLGGHSLLALKALLRVNQALGCALRVGDIYKSPTIRELAERQRGSTAQDAPISLSQEAMLDADLVGMRERPRVPAEGILLTGATGFVGRFLLAQLLGNTDATIYCLVRPHAGQSAASRLKATLKKWNLWDDQFERRIVPVTGDIRRPRLGIDDRTYQLLGHRVDSIYDCATSMNHLETYAMAKAANVEGARELLRLATSGRPKIINYISTLGIFGATASDVMRVVDERSSIDHETYLSSQGYLASKWVAEKIFMTADERGIPCNIFRLGLVWADSQLGRFDELQNVYRVLKTSLLSQCGIENYRYGLPPTPVDYVARAIVFLANRHTGGHGIFHISSSEQKIEDLFGRLNRIGGTALRLLPHYDWICEIKRLHHEGRSLPAVPLIDYAFSMDKATFDQHQRSARSAANVRFDFTRTHRELEEAGIQAAALDDHLLELCLQDMLGRDPDLRDWDEVRQGFRQFALR